MGNYTIFGGFENPRRGRQARNLTTNVPKILDLNSSSEQIFSKNCRWVPLTISHMRDFQGNDLPKFIEFSMEKPCCCPSETDMVAGNQKKLLSLSLATKA